MAAALRAGQRQLGFTALFARPPMSSLLTRPVPDWAVMDRELRRAGVRRAVVGRVSHPISGRLWLCLVLRSFQRMERPGATGNAPSACGRIQEIRQF